MKLLQTGLLFTTLLLAPFYAGAADTPAANTPAPNWYDVELIVFRYTDPHAGSLETWPVSPGTPDWDSAVPLNPAGSGLPYMQISPSSFRLDNAWRKLKRSPDYEPLLHVAWAQPAIDRASALSVRIGTPPAAPAATTASPAAATAGVADTGTPVYGIAKISTTGPYLHFDLDLIYRGAVLSPSPQTNSSQTHMGAPVSAFQWYRLTQDRRIDAGKLNYFDHPLFGVLILVTPGK